MKKTALLFTCLLLSQVSAYGDSTHDSQDHEAKKQTNASVKADDSNHKDHDEHKEDEGHKDHDDHKDHEEHGAHQHGAAQMTMAVDKNRLEIMLETPAANVFGFEHQASSDKDKQVLKDRKALLEDTSKLFKIDDEAGCHNVKSHIQSALLEVKNEHSEDKHNDVDASWRFKCKDTQALKHISVNLFSAFPGGFEKIKVDWITPTKASTVTLDKDDTIHFQ